jgi:endonuclease YncB( thermonuclease family)
MISRERNYAFIDGQNMHKGTVQQGWRVDYGKFRVYLRNKYQVEKAYIFFGYLKENEFFYQFHLK